MIVNVGLIGPKRSASGYGLGHYVAREVFNCPMSALTAVMGTTETSVRQAVDLINTMMGGTRMFSGAQYTAEQREEFFRRDDIDLVIICSPSRTHESYIREALRNGKHVLVEKPLLGVAEGICLPERIKLAHDLLNMANARKLFLSTNCQRAAVLPVLRKEFGMTETPSTVKIELTVGTKSSVLEGPESLFDLLIAHPLSLLVKIGCRNYQSIEVQKHSARSGRGLIRLQLEGCYPSSWGGINYTIVLQQSKKQSLATMRMTIDDVGPVDITTISTDEGDVLTQCNAYNASSPVIVEDTLRTSVRRMVSAVARVDAQYLPLITNDESLEIYAAQEVIREAIFCG